MNLLASHGLRFIKVFILLSHSITGNFPTKNSVRWKNFGESWPRNFLYIKTWAIHHLSHLILHWVLINPNPILKGRTLTAIAATQCFPIISVEQFLHNPMERYATDLSPSFGFCFYFPLWLFFNFLISCLALPCPPVCKPEALCLCVCDSSHSHSLSLSSEACFLILY